MTPALDTLHFTVQYFTGKEYKNDDGNPYYVASCEAIIGVTQGETWHDLMQNIHKLVEAFLAYEPAVKVYNLAPNPRIVITMELPENYAEMM